MISIVEQDIEGRQTFCNVLQSENTCTHGKVLRIHVLKLFITKFTSFIVKGIYKNLPHDSPTLTPSTPSYAFIHSIRVVRSLKFSDQPRKRPQTCC